MDESDEIQLVIDVPLYDRGRALRFQPMEFCKILGEKRIVPYGNLKVWDAQVKQYIADIEAWRKDVLTKINDINFPEDEAD